MWECNICKKNVVADKGKGFRFFVEYNHTDIIETEKGIMPLDGKCTHQVRICEKCLKKDYQKIIV